MFYGFDPQYLVLVIISTILGAITQGYIKNQYAKWSEVPSHIGTSGANVARQMLNDGGASNVGIARVGGTLSDYYDPRDNNLHLSQQNYEGASVASLAVACHEAGHAVQTANNFIPVKIRTALVPVVNFAQRGWMFIFLAGALLRMVGLMHLAIIFFAATVVFQFVTLPVEIDASRRALNYLSTRLPEDEVAGARKVLIAAALTYVAGALISVLNLLYLMSRTNRR